jgi:hypothetical protein
MSVNTMNVDDKATISRRVNSDRRAKPERRQRVEKPPVERRAMPDRRQKVERRRQIDPTTCERDYTTAEIEFMTAMDKYRRESGRPFPTWSEVLEVVMALGYQKIEKPADQPPVITGV